MASDFSHLNRDEQLRAENEFLKMKLMLEKGAQFGITGEMERLPAEIENKFLKHIIEFEEQAAQPVTATVFETLNKPTHFKPVQEIPEDQIDQAWKELSAYLQQHSVRLDVCSPNVSSRELYRFTMEEFFKLEMNLICLPGMMSCFIYDEFHPDPVYETSRMAEHDLLGDIFSANKLFCEISYDNNGFVFNNRFYQHRHEYFSLINQFKSFYDTIELDECNITECVVNEGVSEIKGHYAATAKVGLVVTVFAGHFNIRLCMDEMGYWNFKNISIQGFDPK
jgi:hypothetical protein